METDFYFLLETSPENPAKITRIHLLPRPDENQISAQRKRFPEVVAMLETALNGGGCPDLEQWLEPDFHTPWTERVLRTLRSEVPRGGTVTYGELARRVGSPGAARAVGAAMAFNPFPLYIPCHRVIAFGGKPGGFMGTWGDTPELRFKHRLLKAEGFIL